MRWMAEAARMGTRKRLWLAVLLACLLPSCARAPSRLPAPPPQVVQHAPLPRREVLDLALQAYQCALARGDIRRPLLTIIDYSLPSSEKRLWVLDPRRKRVLFHELVAHGVNSGDTWAVAFSNRVNSRQTSLGLFRTDELYVGRHGTSLRLSGLEPGINDNARRRAIVMHGADYVSDWHAHTMGRLGRSWGCPALPRQVNDRVVARIQGGSAVFAYYPDRAWLQQSQFLNCDARYVQR